MSRELLQQALDALEYHTQQTRPIHSTEWAIDALSAALAQPEPEPVAWRYQDARGHYRYRKYVAGFDVEYAILKPVPLYAAPVCNVPETDFGNMEPVGWLESPHGAFRANLLYRFNFPSQLLEWKIPLYAAPPAAPIDGFGGNLDEAFERAPAGPDDAALNTLAKLFHRGEEIEGDDGAAMMVDLSLWHEASEAFDSLIGDGDGETLASSAAPAAREPQASVLRSSKHWSSTMSNTPLPEPIAWTSSRNGGKTWITTNGDPTDLMPDEGGIVHSLHTDNQLRVYAAAVSAAKDARIKVLEEALWAADLAFAEHGILAVHATRMQVRAALGDKNG